MIKRISNVLLKRDIIGLESTNNMIQLYYFDISKNEKIVKENAFFLIGEDDVYASKLYFTEYKRIEFLSTCLIKRYIFENILGISDYKNAISKGKYGKPYDVKNRYEFNFSTNRKCIVCGIHNNVPIGVDIETKRNFPEKALIPFFSSEDISCIKKKPELLTKLWTRKEAYLKCIGTGWSVKSDVSVHNDEMCVGHNKYGFIEYKLESNLIGSICYISTNNLESVNIVEIKAQDLLEMKKTENVN